MHKENKNKTEELPRGNLHQHLQRWLLLTDQIGQMIPALQEEKSVGSLRLEMPKEPTVEFSDSIFTLDFIFGDQDLAMKKKINVWMETIF